MELKGLSPRCLKLPCLHTVEGRAPLWFYCRQHGLALAWGQSGLLRVSPWEGTRREEQEWN